MNIVSTLKKQFEEGAQALWFVGTAMAVIAIIAFGAFAVLQTSGLALYEPAQHHDFVVAHIDNWFRWLQIFYIVFVAFWITGAVSAVMALMCYAIEMVAGTFKSRFKKA